MIYKNKTKTDQILDHIQFNGPLTAKQVLQWFIYEGNLANIPHQSSVRTHRALYKSISGIICSLVKRNLLKVQRISNGHKYYSIPDTSKEFVTSK